MEFKVPFRGRSHHYTEDEIQTVVEVMRSTGNLTQGEHLKNFQTKFANYIGSSHCFGVMNATVGLDLIAELCQLQQGEEVIVPSHTFTSSVYPFLKRGASIKWADIDLNTFVVSEEQIEPLISSKTRAIIVPHLYGYVANMPAIRKLADQHGLILIEDSAQVIGCEIEGKSAGTFGHFGVFSFHSHKNITTLGEGGMLVVEKDEHASLIPMMRHNGHCAFQFEREDYWIPAMGNVDIPQLNGKDLAVNNFCIGEAEAALGAKMLDRVDEINDQKRQKALIFIDNLKPHSNMIFLRNETRRHNYHLLVCYETSGKRNEFIRSMAYEHGIQCIAQYCPLNRYDYYKKQGLGDAALPNTDMFYDNMISFPFHHCLSEDDLNYMMECSLKTLKSL